MIPILQTWVEINTFWSAIKCVIKGCDRQAEITAVFLELLLQAPWAIPIAGFTTPVPMSEVTTPLADVSEQDIYLCLSPS